MPPSESESEGEDKQLTAGVWLCWLLGRAWRTKAHPLLILGHSGKNAEESNMGCVAYKEGKGPDSLHKTHLGIEFKGEADERGICQEQTLNSSSVESRGLHSWHSSWLFELLPCFSVLILPCWNYCRASSLSCPAGYLQPEAVAGSWESFSPGRRVTEAMGAKVEQIRELILSLAMLPSCHAPAKHAQLGRRQEPKQASMIPDNARFAPNNLLCATSLFKYSKQPPLLPSPFLPAFPRMKRGWAWLDFALPQSLPQPTEPYSHSLSAAQPPPPQILTGMAESTVLKERAAPPLPAEEAMAAVVAKREGPQFISEAAVRGNAAILDYCRTSVSALSGATAGILGLNGLYGFIFYFLASVLLSVLLVLKAGRRWSKYFKSRRPLFTGGLIGGRRRKKASSLLSDALELGILAHRLHSSHTLPNICQKGKPVASLLMKQNVKHRPPPSAFKNDIGRSSSSRFIRLATRLLEFYP
ncbi:Transmembrane protein 93, partial [Ophiophagus hannah]